jgi:NADPH-dependent 2,4-dienoyl-CoA reductase/sulfur reductase-like enzyme
MKRTAVLPFRKKSNSNPPDKKELSLDSGEHISYDRLLVATVPPPLSRR